MNCRTAVWLFAWMFMASIVNGQFSDIEVNSDSEFIAKKGGIDWEDLFEDIFEESDLIEDSKFIQADYYLLPTLAGIGENIKVEIPPVGLHIEGQLFHNSTWRFSTGTQWWEEEIILAQSPDRDFTETFKFQYWTAGLGGAWHFNLGEKIDPYVGYLFSYRHLYATCDCITEHNSTFTHDLFAGVRYFLGTGFFVSAEVGSHGPGFISGGIGIRF